MDKVVIVGGGWAGCAAALAVRKAGAEAILMEKTDLLLGLGNVGGIMRNNGRDTAAEECIAMGAGELFGITDRLSRHRGLDFPGHHHASLYDVRKTEAAVRRLLQEKGVRIRLMTRATDVDCRKEATGYTHIKKVLLSDKTEEDGGMFIETTGSAGPMGNCLAYGNGCCMCILRCPSFGPRVSLSQKAGKNDIMGQRKDGSFGAFSGAGELEKGSLGKELLAELEKNGKAVLPLPPEMVAREKLELKVCQQYALDEYAENLILLDTGQVKVMTPFFPLEKLRQLPGLENARYASPCAGGKGNSVRYLSVAEREDSMQVKGIDNLFCGGEKSGLFVGHTEAIVTGTLAGCNAVRRLKGLPPLILPPQLATGDLISYANRRLKEEEGLSSRYTFAGGLYFARMKKKGLYTTSREEILRRVQKCGLEGIYSKPLF